MKIHKKSTLGELGSMMVEALAMLGLISMVTPVVYKKAAERNTEIQDVNAAAQMRTLVRAVDEYIQDNYSEIVAGNTIENECNGASSVDYSSFDSTGDESVVVNIKHLCDYLPYGFLDSSGNLEGNKIFNSNYKMAIKKVEGTGVGKNKRVLTGFLVAQPNQGEDFPKIRASRIASMIGGNGGYVDSGMDGEGNDVQNAYGVQGMWEIDDIDNNLGISGVKNGSIITTSAQPISFGRANYDNVLHRVHEEKENGKLNTMETTLMMGYAPETGQNIENVNRMIITAANSSPINGQKESGWEEKALWVSGTNAGAYIEGKLQAAAGEFIVDENANLKTKGTLTAAEEKFVVGENGTITAVTDKFVVDENANVKAKGTLDVADEKFKVAADGSFKASNEEFTVDATGNTVVGKTYNAADTTSYKLTVNGNAWIKGILRLGRLKTDRIDTGSLYAGTNDVANNDRNQYTVYADQNRFVIGATTTTDNIGVFNVERAGYTYAKGLRAGMLNGTVYPFEVADDANGNVTMRHRTTSSQIRALSSAGNELMNLNNDTSTMQSFLTSARYARLRLNSPGDAAELQARNATNAGVVKVSPTRITLDVNPTIDASGNTTSDGNLALYKSSHATTGVNRNQVWLQGNTDLKVLDSGKSVIFNVDQSGAMKDTVYADTADGKGKGAVYVRKGVIELSSNNTANITKPSFADGSSDIGYIKGDMFVAQKAMDSNAFLDFNEYYGSGTVTAAEKYNMYMLNPAYTSVMHDIKLTSRGGARLSDILPDFINRGIYVVDSSYREDAINAGNIWTCSGSSCTGVASPLGYGSSLPATAALGEFASAWLGVVPAPKCPPGYQKVITVMPLGFSMAQTGMVWNQLRDGFYTASDAFEQINFLDQNPYHTADPTFEPVPYYFQKSTNLRTRVYEHGADKNFKGWSVMMGFIYPYNLYKYNGTKKSNGVDEEPSIYYETFKGDVVHNEGNKYMWNLYPVLAGEMEAYATVYCYFTRDEFGNNALVDKNYDQLKSYQNGNLSVTEKNNSIYTDRLNDPNLKYKDPW
ncbi:MAG: hypothetical protein PHE89_03080 [Alphaproteobacteria bacterium]|nr:hypothetical protein [Alphaproteobacteria bacterium]